MRYDRSVKTLAIILLNTAITLGLLAGGLYWYEQRESVANTVQEESSGLSLIAGVPNVVESVLPSVVSIVVTADVPIYERRYRSFPGFFGREVVLPRTVQVGTERVEVGGGSGFVVSSDGYVMTNNHVVSSRDVDYSVLTDDGQTFDARVVYRNPDIDIAVVKIGNDQQQFPALSFGNSDTLRLGEPVIAIGNALAEFPNSVSVGVVSGLAREITATDSRGRAEMLEGLIQTDAAINRGNSGGPLLNGAGHVIGMNVAVADGTENIGFAIPANLVRDVLGRVLSER